MKYLNKLIKGDCIEVMNHLDKESIDLVVTSPPYNIGIDYDIHDDDMEHEDYLQFTEKWMEALYPLMKNNGRVCINIPIEAKGKNLYYEFVRIAKKVGFNLKHTVLWVKYGVGGNRMAVGTWYSPQSPCTILPVESIILLYKDQWKVDADGREPDISKKEFMDYTYAVWRFSGSNKNVDNHPASFPIDIPYRCIKLLSFPKAVVLDPFIGVGTTAIACLKTKRNFIGIEISNDYLVTAMNRVKKLKINYKLTGLI